MKITPLVILGLVATVATCQTTAKPSPRVTLKGSCNATAIGNGNQVKVECGIPKDQVQDFVKLMNKALAANNPTVLLKKMDAKLDELLLQQPTYEQNCVSGNCVQNGNQTNVDQRQYGVPKPLPLIVGLRIDQLPPGPKRVLPDKSDPHYQEKMMDIAMDRDGTGVNSNPGATAIFSVSSNFMSPMFEIQCDRPCKPTNIMFSDCRGNGGFNGTQFPFYRTNSPDVWITQHGQTNMLVQGDCAEVSFRSFDSGPITVTRVEAYSQ